MPRSNSSIFWSAQWRHLDEYFPCQVRCFRRFTSHVRRRWHVFFLSDHDAIKIESAVALAQPSLYAHVPWYVSTIGPAARPMVWTCCVLAWSSNLLFRHFYSLARTYNHHIPLHSAIPLYSLAFPPSTDVTLSEFIQNIWHLCNVGIMRVIQPEIIKVGAPGDFFCQCALEGLVHAFTEESRLSVFCRASPVFVPCPRILRNTKLTAINPFIASTLNYRRRILRQKKAL